jgi:hypothetical protein
MKIILLKKVGANRSNAVNNPAIIFADRVVLEINKATAIQIWRIKYAAAYEVLPNVDPPDVLGNETGINAPITIIPVATSDIHAIVFNTVRSLRTTNATDKPTMILANNEFNPVPSMRDPKNENDGFEPNNALKVSDPIKSAMRLCIG